MKVINKNNFPKLFAAAALLYLGTASVCFADIYINVVAVNGAATTKTSTIHFDLPGELTAEDILDTGGLQLDYSVDDADYFVFGDVTLKPKESKIFKIQVKDKWMVTPDEVTTLKGQIEQGYQTLGKPYNAANAQILKDRLDSQIDYIVNLQSTNADSIDKRIDAYRMYVSEMKRIQDQALDVTYWRSDPNEAPNTKIIHLDIEVTNPTEKIKHFKHKDYLPAEVKPEDVVEPEDFEVRFDQIKELAFLFKEEDLNPHETKKYSIGILDIWNIDQKKLDYLRSRADYCWDYLKDSKYADSAKVLMDRITANLKAIEDSQAIQRPILDHISAFRANKQIYDTTEENVENLEKLLSVYREDLEKSKVENILQRIQSLKGVADVSKVMFNKKFESTPAWSFIAWILLFVALLTLVNFVVALLRSKDKKISDAPPSKKANNP